MRPTGSGSAATARMPSAIARMRDSSSFSRSSMTEDIVSFAASISFLFSQRIEEVSAISASAIARSALFFSSLFKTAREETAALASCKIHFVSFIMRLVLSFKAFFSAQENVFQLVFHLRYHIR